MFKLNICPVVYRETASISLLPAIVLLLALTLCAARAAADAGPTITGLHGNNLWQSIGEYFNHSGEPGFDSDVERADIQAQLNWLKRNPEYLYRVTRRSERYAWYVVSNLRERGMPLELALLPIVESAYDAYAYSPGRAAGLWQFVPSTGEHFGLAQNWWYDARRDPVASTDAALDYLQQLHDRFDDWLLAIAAYNAGPARVSRAFKKHRELGRPTDYWSLKLPEETRLYVPRMLALKAVLSNPSHFDMRIYPVDNAPFFAEVFVDSQLDLAQAAKLADVSMEELYRLNPGLSRWATPPDGPHSLLVPFEKKQRFITELARTPVRDRLRWERYKVRSGDSLGVIARKHSTDVASIKKANGLASSRIRAGQHLLIPMASEAGAHYVLSETQRMAARGLPRSGRQKLVHKVRAGESWWSIGKRYGVSSTTLAKWNGKAPGDTIRPGQQLFIWKKAGNSGSQVVYRSLVYKVRSGDNLSRIASRYSVSVNQLLSWNDISADHYLQPGQPLKIKVAVAGGA